MPMSKGDRPMFRWRIAPIRWWSALHANRFGNRHSAAAQLAKKLDGAVGRGFIPGINPIKPMRALQAAGKHLPAVGQGFIPGIRSADSTRALAPEACFSGIRPETWPFFATSAAAVKPDPSVFGFYKRAFALAAVLTCASLACFGQADAATALPDSPQPQATASAAPTLNPCLVKRASVGMANAAAGTALQAAPVIAGNDAAAAAADALGKPQPTTPGDIDVILVPCTAVERLISNLQQVKRLPGVNWYARFLDGPQVQRMTPKQKAWLAFRNVADPFNTITILGSSVVAVAANSHSAYGPGMTGWGKYVGVSYSQDMTGEFFGTFLIPSIVHQDPHYHRMPGASMKRRIAHVIYQVGWTQGDDGKGMINYADLVGFGIDDEIANLYVPGRQTRATATAQRYATAWPLLPPTTPSPNSSPTWPAKST
jgi:hypothetical protein